jgi:crotonobetainyl-CoA:carnitine CoA-transferase CaiB-like acyl-CoA transferase
MTGPLDGVRVLELAQYAYVPSAGAVLADWGADVTKVEHPTSSDPMRGMRLAALAGVDTSSSTVPFTYDVVNRGKRSVGIDAGTPAGLELVMTLVEQSDVFLTNFLPDARRRLGIDVEHVQSRNPAIVYAKGSGYGPGGPDAATPGFDSVSFWARTGIASAVTFDDAAMPAPLPGMGFGDVLSGALLAGGVAAALVRRQRDGSTCVVDGSLLASGMWAMQPAVVAASLYGVEDLRLTRVRDEIRNPLASSYRTSDGRVIVLAMLDSQRYWGGFCKAIGRPDLEHDQRFATAQLREDNSSSCVAVLDETFSGRTASEWSRLLGTQAGAWTLVAVARDLLDDEQAWANGYLQTVDYQALGEATFVSSPVAFDGAPPKVRRGPEHGQHTEEVLLEMGLDWDRISMLKDRGVIC